ncbi:hypothetical protein GCM10009579_82590 [Streptomyces javensis]|uniref:Uncharacterized protein n=1 Tax=Streptomyces javensis TaxID=114698 RepID=A0ABN1XCR0_9ACTN
MSRAPPRTHPAGRRLHTAGRRCALLRTHEIAHALLSNLGYVDRASGALSARQARELVGSIRDTGEASCAAVLPGDLASRLQRGRYPWP